MKLEAGRVRRCGNWERCSSILPRVALPDGFKFLVNMRAVYSRYPEPIQAPGAGEYDLKAILSHLLV